MGEKDFPKVLGNEQAPPGGVARESVKVWQPGEPEPPKKIGNTIFAGDWIQTPGNLTMGPNGNRAADPNAYYTTKHYPVQK